MNAPRHHRRRLLTATVCVGLLLLLPGCGTMRPAPSQTYQPAAPPPSLANGIGAADSLGQVVFASSTRVPGDGVASVPVLND
jgi:hypothetical protein